MNDHNWTVLISDQLRANTFLATLPIYTNEQLADINPPTLQITANMVLAEDKLKVELRAITNDYIHATGTHRSVQTHFSHIYSLDEIMDQLQTHPNKTAIVEELCDELNVSNNLYESIETWKIIHKVHKAKRILAHLVGGNAHMDVEFMKQTLTKHPDWLSPRDKIELAKYI